MTVRLNTVHNSESERSIRGYNIELLNNRFLKIKIKEY